MTLDAWIGNKGDLYYVGQPLFNPISTKDKELGKWYLKDEVFAPWEFNGSPVQVVTKSEKFRICNYDDELEKSFQRMDAANLKSNPQFRVFQSERYQKGVR